MLIYIRVILVYLVNSTNFTSQYNYIILVLIDKVERGEWKILVYSHWELISGPLTSTTSAFTTELWTIKQPSAL